MGADGDGHGHPALRVAQVGGPVLVDLPVHHGRAPVEHLDPVHAAVARAGRRVAAEDQRQGDERPAVLRPAGEDRQPAEVGLVEPDLLAGRLAHDLGRERRQLAQPAQRPHLGHHPLRRLEVHERLDARPEGVERLGAERRAHPPLGAELVDQHRHVAARHVREEQRRATALGHAVGDLGDLEVGVDARRHAREVPVALEPRDPVAQVPHRRASSSSGVGGSPRADLGQPGRVPLDSQRPLGLEQARAHLVGVRRPAGGDRRRGRSPEGREGVAAARRDDARPQGDEVGERLDHEEVAGLGDPNQAVGVAVVAGQHLAAGLAGGEVAGAAVVQEEPLQDQVEAGRLGGGQRRRDERRQQGLGGRLDQLRRERGLLGEDRSHRASAARASASRASLISASPCASPTNQASYCDGGG